MAEFMQQYGTEAKRYRAWSRKGTWPCGPAYRVRWPHGFRDPTCEDRARSRLTRLRRLKSASPQPADLRPTEVPEGRLAPPARCAVRAGSTSCWTTTHGSPQGTSNARSAAATRRSGRIRTTAGSPFSGCAALSGGSRVSFQPSVSPARDDAATGARHEAVQAVPRTDLTLGEQFSWLRFGAISISDSASGGPGGKRPIRVLFDHTSGELLCGISNFHRFSVH